MDVLDMKKEHIANLFRQLSFFRPELTRSGNFTGRFLVNQISVQKAKAEQASKSALATQLIPPDLDTLLDMIGKAGVEISEFIKEMDMASTGNEIMMRHMKDLDSHMNAMLGDDGKDLNPLEKMEKVQGRYEQMAQFFNDLVNHSHPNILPEFVMNPARYINGKVNSKHAQKETTAGGPVQQAEEQNGDSILGATGGGGPALQLFITPSDIATGEDRVVTPAGDAAPDSGGVDASGSDKP